MRTETYQDMIEETRKLHSLLAERLQQGATQQTDERAKWLMEYLADHERTLASTVEGFVRQAEGEALKTWLYEHVTENLPPTETRGLDFAGMGFEETAEKVLGIHNQLIDLYRSMTGRAAIPEAKELMQGLLTLEENETLRLAKQIDSARAL